MNTSNTLRKILIVFIAAIVLTMAIAPCRIRASAAEGNLIIMIDPGHGGIDGGAENTVGGVYYNENKLMLKVANYAKSELSQYPGVTVLLTRDSTETTLTLAERVSKATSNGAHAIISIHANSYSGSGSAQGAEALVAGGNYRPDTANATKSIGTKILTELQGLGLKNRGIKTRLDNQDKIIEYYPDGSIQDYYGIVQRALRAGIPGVIIETAFISNESDVLNFFSTDSKLQSLGKAIATGVAKHYGLSKSSQATATQRPHIDGRELIFSGNPDTSLLYPLGGTGVSQSEGCATLTKGSDGIKIYIDYRGMSFSADTYKYAVIRIKSSSPGATATINTGAHKITYDTTDFTYNATLGTDYQNILIDMSGNSDWQLAVNFIKIQISGAQTANIEYIKFYNSKASIENGSNAVKPTVVPTTAPTVPPASAQIPVPTVAPTKNPDSLPTNTAAPTNTIVPAASDESVATIIPTSGNTSETDNITATPNSTETVYENKPATNAKSNDKDYTVLIIASILLPLVIVANVMIIMLNKHRDEED